VDLERRLFPVDTFQLVGLETLAVLIIVRDRIVEVANQMTADEVSQNSTVVFPAVPS
jgi:hypothetical protein